MPKNPGGWPPENNPDQKIPQLKEGWISFSFACITLKIPLDKLKLFLLSYKEDWPLEFGVANLATNPGETNVDEVMSEPVFEDLKKKVTSGERPMPPPGWLETEQVVWKIGKNLGLMHLKTEVIPRLIAMNYPNSQNLVDQGLLATFPLHSQDEKPPVYMSPRLQIDIERKVEEAYERKVPGIYEILNSPMHNLLCDNLNAEGMLKSTDEVEDLLPMVLKLIENEDKGTILHKLEYNGELVEYMDLYFVSSEVKKYAKKTHAEILKKFQDKFFSNLPPELEKEN